MENTEGFDQKTLDKMNSEVKKTMSKHDSKSKEYKKVFEQVEDQIFDKYCTEVFRPSLKL
jgi:serine/threonine-protein kinase RIO1